MTKRKEGVTQSTSKRVKKDTQSSSGISSKEITLLSQEIIENFKINNIPTLLDELESIRLKLVLKYLKSIENLGRELSLSLFNIFNHLLKSSKLKVSSKDDEKKQLVTKWLISKYDSFKQILFLYFNQPLATETSLQLDLLSIILQLIKLESIYLKSSEKDLYFPQQTYNEFVISLITSSIGEILSDGSNTNFIILEFLDKYLTNWDLQFYLINSIGENLIEWKDKKIDKELQLIFSNLFIILKQKLLFQVEDCDNLIENLPSIAYKPSHFKSQYQKVILTLLSYPLINSQYKSIILILHKRIMPFMQQPQQLLDFLTDCYDIEDDIIPLLSLNSLWELMKNYNLEYNDFYTKLYSLITTNLLYSRYRSRFFRLLDLFLSSTHLSGNLLASFIKKFSRLSLEANSPSIVIIIPFIYNLMKRHPTCMIMLHNNEDYDEYNDVYNFEEKDPMKTGAMKSSLWELETLMSHYHPNISTLARIFGEPFRKHLYNMEDFLDWSYQSLLDSEKTRRYKVMAALEFEKFDKVFGQSDEKKTVYANGWSL